MTTHSSQKTRSQTIHTNNPYEKLYGYARAVRRGPMICVSGTTSIRPSPSPSSFPSSSPPSAEQSPPIVEYPGDAKKQAILALERSIQAIQDLGGSIEDITRIKWYVKRFEDCDAVGVAMGEVMRAHTAAGREESNVGELVFTHAATMVLLGESGGFVSEDLLVEVEVDAYVLD